MRADDQGAALLKSRPSIVGPNDREALLAMPEGSNGRAYYDFVHREAYPLMDWLLERRGSQVVRLAGLAR